MSLHVSRLYCWRACGRAGATFLGARAVSAPGGESPGDGARVGSLNHRHRLADATRRGSDTRRASGSRDEPESQTVRSRGQTRSDCAELHRPPPSGTPPPPQRPAALATFLAGRSQPGRERGPVPEPDADWGTLVGSGVPQGPGAQRKERRGAFFGAPAARASSRRDAGCHCSRESAVSGSCPQAAPARDANANAGECALLSSRSVPKVP